MNANHIFISHATEDDDFVKKLRLALEGQGLKVWVDSRDLIGGQRLAPEIEQAIEQARQFIVVLSPQPSDQKFGLGPRRDSKSTSG